MKRFKIHAKLISDIVMSIIMIPFLLISAFTLGIATVIHFVIWWINRKL
jgi:hypothetical protein